MEMEKENSPLLEAEAETSLRQQPRKRSWRLKAACLGLVCLAGLHHLPSWKFPGCHHHHGAGRSVYGRFPKPDDPFSFIPCTNATLPPALEDSKPQRSWAKLFDPNPDHWNWGNVTEKEASSGRRDPYDGRGIYLCGYLDVPLDYTNKSDPRIARLAVTKYQVSGLARRDGRSKASTGKKSERTIVIEPGGPGGSGTSMAWRAAEEQTKRFTDSQFDVLGWDPRGVNASLPAISCFPYDADRDRWALRSGQYREVSASPRAQLEFADAMNDAIFSACKEIHGDLPRFVSTAFVARDVEEIRKALDEKDLTGYFVSYGTGIGQTYAQLFPESVGRLIMDGTEYVLDHRLLGGFGWTALDNATDAWNSFLGECVNAGPEHCALAKAIDKDKPVTLKNLQDRMQFLISSIAKRPIPTYTKTSGPALITYSGIVGAAYQAMYSATTWPALAQALFELESGNSTLAAIMMETMWEYDPTISPASRNPSSDELGTLVICADGYDAPLPPDGLDWWEQLWANMTEKSWISGNSRFFNVFPCQQFLKYWPEPAEVYRGSLNHTLRTPVLLIAEHMDPATPLRNGRRLLKDMGQNARLVAHHGYGHSSRDKSNCTEAIARAYMLEGKLPDKQETDCFANEKPYMYGVGKDGAAKDSGRVGDPVKVWEGLVATLKIYNPGLLSRR